MGYGGSSNIILKFDTTVVFNAAAPTTWTDLNLSSVVGANQAVVILRTSDTSDSNAFRTNGVSIAVPLTNGPAYYMVVTDTNGVCEWITNFGDVTVVTMVAYLKVRL